MKTADRIVVGPVHAPFSLSRHPGPAATWTEGVEAVQRYLLDCPHILADNVATYVHHSDREYVIEDFPSLAPPWPQFWIEYPSRSGRQRRGVFVRDITESLDDALDGSAHEAIEDARSSGYDGLIRWVVSFTLFVEDHRKQVIGPMGWTILVLDPSGRVVGNRWVIGVPSIEGMPDPTEAGLKAAVRKGMALTPDDRRQVEEISGAIKDTLNDSSVRLSDDQLVAGLLAAWQSIAFLHCRNVKVDQVEARPKLDQLHRKKHGRPLLRFQTVRLEVPRRSSDRKPGTSPGTPPALHIVPGNFHHYGDCCPTSPACGLSHDSQRCKACGGHNPHGLLFGRHTGVYWTPQHVRGNPERGEIRSDFDLQVKES